MGNISSSASALIFQSTTFDVVDRNGQPWLRAQQIGDALGYTDDKSINRIYVRNSADFHCAMTEVVTSTTSGNLTTETRIFSLRGAHLIGMFARTERAAEFRRWVLDVLEQHTQALPQQAGDTLIPSEQQTLSEIAHRKVEAVAPALQGKALAELWSRLHNKFRVAKYSQLPRHQLADAIVYIGQMQLRSAPAAPTPQAPELLTRNDMANLSRLVWLIAHWFGDSKAWTQAVWFALRQATGTRAPQVFTVDQLPVLAAELRRCWLVAEQLRAAQREAEAIATQRIVRRGEAAEPVLAELRAQMIAAAEKDHAAFNSLLAAWNERELLKLTAREAGPWNDAWATGAEPAAIGSSQESRHA